MVFLAGPDDPSPSTVTCPGRPRIAGRRAWAAESDPSRGLQEMESWRRCRHHLGRRKKETSVGEIGATGLWGNGAMVAF